MLYFILDGYGTSNSATVCDVQGLVAARNCEWNLCVLTCPSKCLENKCQNKQLEVGCSRCVPNDFSVPEVCCKKRIDRIISSLDNRWNACLDGGCSNSCRFGQCRIANYQCDITKISLCIPTDK